MLVVKKKLNQVQEFKNLGTFPYTIREHKQDAYTFWHDDNYKSRWESSASAQFCLRLLSILCYIIQLSKFLLLRLCIVLLLLNKISKIKMTSNNPKASLRELRMTSAMSSLASSRTKAILTPSSSSTNTRLKKVRIPTYTYCLF